MNQLCRKIISLILVISLAPITTVPSSAEETCLVQPVRVEKTQDIVSLKDLETSMNSFKLNLPNISKSLATIVVNSTQYGFDTILNIKNQNAPKEYIFDLELPNGYRLVDSAEYLGEEFDTKEVFIMNANNEITTIFAPAWAKDDNGKNVETYYNVIDNKLIQVVNFNETNAFPIKAHPSAWQVTKCVSAVVLVIGSTVVTASKLVKIKRYIKALGGVKEAVVLLMGAGSFADIKAAGGETWGILKSLAGELLGIDGIMNNCKFAKELIK